MRFRSRPAVAPATWGLAAPARPRQREQSFILAIAVATVIAWQTQWGSLALYPFTLLATWFHEMGHGLAAAALGASFERLVILPDGSGFAEYSSRGDMGRVSQALIAAAGLLGPSLAGAALIVGSRSRRATRALLVGLGIALIVSALIWVRSLAGWIVLPAFAVAVLAVGAWAGPKLRRFAIELLGVQAAISLWRDLGYLFSDGFVIGGRYMPSDSGAIADALFLPYWVWGGLITAAIVAMLWKALRMASSPSS